MRYSEYSLQDLPLALMMLRDAYALSRRTGAVAAVDWRFAVRRVEHITRIGRHSFRQEEARALVCHQPFRGEIMRKQ